MSWLFGDSFGHYAIGGITTKYTSLSSSFMSGSLTSAASRWGSGSGLRISNTAPAGCSYVVSKTLGPSGGFVQGIFFQTSRVPDTGGYYIFAITETGTAHLYLRLNPDFTLSVVRGGGTVLGTSNPTGLAENVGGFIEWKGTIDDANGTYTVRVNNTEVLTGSAKDTRNGGTGVWTAAQYGVITATGFPVSATLDFCDYYVLDQSGTTPNDFLGDGRMAWHPITGAGANSGFTPSAGANYENVDDATPDDDTTKNTATAVGQKDTFALTDLVSAGGSIKVVQTVIYQKKSAAGTCTIAPVIRHSGTDNDGTPVAPSTDYAFALEGFATNPGTGSAWTESGFNAIEVGYKQVT